MAVGTSTASSCSWPPATARSCKSCREKLLSSLPGPACPIAPKSYIKDVYRWHIACCFLSHAGRRGATLLARAHETEADGEDRDPSMESCGDDLARRSARWRGAGRMSLRRGCSIRRHRGSAREGAGDQGGERIGCGERHRERIERAGGRGVEPVASAGGRAMELAR